MRNFCAWLIWQKSLTYFYQYSMIDREMEWEALFCRFFHKDAGSVFSMDEVRECARKADPEAGMDRDPMHTLTDAAPMTGGQGSL